MNFFDVFVFSQKRPYLADEGENSSNSFPDSVFRIAHAVHQIGQNSVRLNKEDG